MKKRLIILLLSIHIVFVIVLFFFSLNVGKNEFYNFLGNEKITISDIQQYMNDEDRQQNIQIGKNKLKEGGYGSSGDYYIAKIITQDLFPGFVIVVIGEVLLCVSLFIVCQKDLIQKHQLEKENQELLKKNQLIEEHLIRDKEQMKQYEENLYHQLKTPLTGLQLCLDTIKPSSDQKTSIEMAQLETEKMSKLITLFLKDRKMSANQIRFSFEEQDCVLMLQEAMETVKPLAIQNNKTVCLKTEVSSVIIKCDETWLKESFVTILENAIEHGKNDPLIWIRKQGNYILIQIMSQGMIPEEEIPHIFERFYTTNQDHFGIGLHMAKTIIENHHGTLKTYNLTLEDKNVFEIKLPILFGSHAYDEREL